MQKFGKKKQLMVDKFIIYYITDLPHFSSYKMEDINIENNEEKISVNATQILAKYRSVKERINFCFEKNWYHPKEIGFDSNFFLKVIMGEKKYLPNNFTVNYKMHYFRKGEKLDKDYIIQKMKKIQHMRHTHQI